MAEKVISHGTLVEIHKDDQTTNEKLVLTHDGTDSSIVSAKGTINFNDENLSAAIPLSVSGETGLNASITASSLVGAVNEVFVKAGSRKPKVIDIVDGNATPPTTGDGDRYILNDVGNGPVDAGWGGAAYNDIVEYVATLWVAETPEEGWRLYVDALDQDALFVDDGVGQWESQNDTLATLDSAYDGSGAGAGKTITADNGPVAITTADNTALHLTHSHATSSGLLIENNSTAGASIEFSGTASLHTITTDNSINLTSSGGDIQVTGASGDISFQDQWLWNAGVGSKTVYLSESGNVGLSGDFTAISLVGGLNELKSNVLAVTLDQAYDANGSGVGKQITADSGAVDINGDGLSISSGGNVFGQFKPDTDSGLLLGLSSTDGEANNNLVLTSLSNISKAHDHSSLSTNPTLIIHSGTDPDTDNTEFVTLSSKELTGNDGPFTVASSTVLHLGAGSYINIDDPMYTDANIIQRHGTRIVFGSSTNSFLGWLTTQSEPALIMGLDDSKTFLIAEKADIDSLTDFGHSAYTNPTFVIHSSNTTSLDNYFSIYHSGTDSVLTSGNGTIRFDDPVLTTSVALNNGTDTELDTTDKSIIGAINEVLEAVSGAGVGVSGTPVNNQLALWKDANTIEGDSKLTFDGSLLVVNGTVSTNSIIVGGTIYDSTGGSLRLKNTNQTNDAITLGTFSSNNFILSEKLDMPNSFDHPANTNPTFYFQSAENPDTDNTQWGSLTHDQSNVVFAAGKGTITFKDPILTSAVALNNGTDTELDTTDKSIIGAINEVNELASAGGTYDDDIYAVFGDNGETKLGWNTTGQTVPAFVIGTGAGSSSNNIIICEDADKGFNFAHAANTDPTLIIHSADQLTDRYFEMYHNGTDAFIVAGRADCDIRLVPGTSSGKVIIGSTGAVPSMSGSGLYVQSFAEFNSQSEFNNTVHFYGNTRINNTATLEFGTNVDASLHWDTGENSDCLKIGVGNTSCALLIAEQQDINGNFQHANKDNPTIILQSASGAGSAATRAENIQLYHDTSNAIIKSGTGGHICLADDGSGTAVNKEFIPYSEADETTTTLIDVGSQGLGEVSVVSDVDGTVRAWAQFRWKTNESGITSVEIINSSSNATNADTDTYLCLYGDASSNLLLKNRLGQTMSGFYSLKYSKHTIAGES